MREGVKTLLLGLLLALTLIMVGLVWMRVPPETEQIIYRENGSKEVSEELRKSFVPRKAVINFGDKEHTVSYQVENLWPFYESILLQSFPREGYLKGSWKKISDESYYNLHQRPSVAFDLGNKLYSQVFIAAYNLDEPAKGMDGYIKEVYFPTNGAFLVLVTDQGNYRVDLSDVTSQGMEKYVKNLRQEEGYMPYQSLFELYNVKSLSYIPLDPFIEEAHIEYKNDLAQLDPSYEKDMAQRFLGEAVENVHVIPEDGSTLYVYDQKSLRVNKEGMLDYLNRSEKKEKERDLIKSIKEAKDFIGQKTGMGKDVYFESVKEIEKDGAKGYHFSLNYLENRYSVFPLGKDRTKSYIEMDLIENRVEHFSYLYRTDANHEEKTRHRENLLRLDEAIYQNIGEVGLEIGQPGNNLAQILENIKAINLCLVDWVQESPKGLQYAYEVDFGHKKLYFEASGGKLIMER